MTFYSGVKSLDAEITIDFAEGNIHMDYSRNHLGSPYNSNTSAVLDSEWDTMPQIEKLKVTLWISFMVFSLPCLLFVYQPLSTYLANHRTISAKAHYEHQAFLKYFYQYMGGIYKHIEEGDLKTTTCKFHLPHNLWMEYELHGEYQDKIKTISLRRRFLRKKRFGKYWETRQNGWDLIFEFTDIPRSGSVIVREI
jgi:hypothetical protein